METKPDRDPARELGVGAAARDVLAGAVLIAIGLVTGGSSLDGQGVDRLDVFFDALGAAWIVWGVARFAWRAARRRGELETGG